MYCTKKTSCINLQRFNTHNLSQSDIEANSNPPTLVEQQPPPPLLTHQRLNILNLLHSLRRQHERMLLLHANAIFDSNAHAAEMRRELIRVGNVETALGDSGLAGHEWDGRMGYRGKGRRGRRSCLRLNGDALPVLQFCLPRLTWGVVDVETDVVA